MHHGTVKKSALHGVRVERSDDANGGFMNPGGKIRTFLACPGLVGENSPAPRGYHEYTGRTIPPPSG